MSERYTWQEIWDKTTPDFALGNEDLRECVVDVLSLLPKAVADSVIEGCLFLMLEYDPRYISNGVLQNKWLIALPENFLQGDLRQIVHSLFHEIAHFHLKHDLRETMASDQETKRMEAEASRTAEQWAKDAEGLIQEYVSLEAGARESIRRARGTYRSFVEGYPL
ncbi:MAG: hypothetical protein A2Y60_00960 [Chloroflexi bacterium RBG_13_54_9]|nr:MAG: hypothetical protein A2Y60_00960 [Chloroflexi bacterium RBG_13_54_9]